MIEFFIAAFAVDAGGAYDQMDAYRTCLSRALATHEEPRNASEAQELARMAIATCKHERRIVVETIVRDRPPQMAPDEARRQAEENMTLMERYLPDVWTKKQ